MRTEVIHRNAVVIIESLERAPDDRYHLPGHCEELTVAVVVNALMLLGSCVVKEGMYLLIWI